MKNTTITQHGHTTILTINREKVLNTINADLLREVSTALTDIDNSDTRCLIITGAGNKSFIAGGDIGFMANLSCDEAKSFSQEGNALMFKLESLRVPVIAAINGYAFGGGCELALACDIRLASENAQFCFPEVSLGVIPGFGGIQRLIRTIGIGNAKKMIYTAAKMTASQAKESGLVDQTYPITHLLEESIKLADIISKNAPFAIEAAKIVANEGRLLDDSELSLLESEYFSTCFDTIDQQMAMNAFIQKRKPELFIGK